VFASICRRESCDFADVVVLETEETAEDLKQVQIKVHSNYADAVWDSKLKETV